jgi:hypothetical protein
LLDWEMYRAVLYSASSIYEIIKMKWNKIFSKGHYNIKMYLKEIEWESVDKVHV